jgi:hypothetical protein
MRNEKDMSRVPKSVWYVSLARKTGLPKWGDPEGDGASIVVVGVTTYQGKRESRLQGEGRQVDQSLQKLSEVSRTATECSSKVFRDSEEGLT